MKKIFCMLLILSIAVSAFSQRITIGGEAPTSGIDILDSKLKEAFDELKQDLNNRLGELSDSIPTGFIQAFGNASVYSSHGATQRGYGGYKTFAATLGPSLGLQLPISPFKIKDMFSGDSDPLEGIFDEGDIKLGLNSQIINAQIGLNTSFLLKDLYLGLRIGFTPNLGNMIGDTMGLDGILGDMGGLKFSFSNFLIGITANYQLVQGKSIVGGLITWRGVNLGTGLLFQNTKFNMTYSLDPIEQPFTDVEYGELRLYVDPSLSFDMNITTFTIPLEVITAVNLLIFNIPLGVGADFAFGKSKMNIGMDSNIDIKADIKGKHFETTKPGHLTVEATGDRNPSFANFKLMTGIGLSIGPVIVIDIPVTWYFLDHGFNIGLTAGLAF